MSKFLVPPDRLLNKDDCAAAVRLLPHWDE
jgi:hypothetical protein